LRTWTPERVFQEFSPLLEQKKGTGKDKSEEIQRLIAASHRDEASRGEPDSSDEQALDKVVWDARWLDAGIKADQPTAVCCLARPGHRGALDYLLKLGDAKKTSDAGWVVRALARCQYPKVTDYFLDLVAKKTKGAKYFDYELQFLFENARHLPLDDLSKLDDFAAKLDEKFVDRFLAALAPLRPTNQPN
jgi:hypothetical protein